MTSAMPPGPRPRALVLRYIPGTLLALIAAALAYWVAAALALPVMLVALAVGLPLYPLAKGERFRPGIDFAAKKVLRLGVALLGAGITVSQIASLGLATGLLAVGCVGFTIACGLLVARWLGEQARSGLLFGGAVAICGASAALAISAAMPEDEDSEAQTLLAVIGVTALSTVAMVLYPALTGALDLDDRLAGIFFGLSIHDVAQVVGAGFMVSAEAGDTATIVKLMRVACLVPVVALVAWSMRPRGADGAAGDGAKIPLLPVFLIGFVILSLVASSGWVPQEAMKMLADIGKALLVIAIAALGCKTSLSALYRIGWTPVLLLLLPTLLLGAFSLSILMLAPVLFR